MQAPMQEANGADVPETLQLLGRVEGRENHDICGEYVRAGSHQGRAVYKQRGGRTVIAFRKGRWVIDREGIRDSDLVVAWANDHGALVPADQAGGAKLLWHVYEERARSFVQDPELLVLEAPSMLSFFCGGANTQEICGEFRFAGINCGRPFYKSSVSNCVIRYNADEKRWMISCSGETGNCCTAFADAIPHGSMHPGDLRLRWVMYDGRTARWIEDPSAQAVMAPSRVHVLGRHPQAYNARICGTYLLSGVRDGMPLYMKPGSHAVIRHSNIKGRWLIDCDALAKPGFVGRFLQWIQTGDSSDAADKCSAFAESRGTSHPGHVELDWQVWEASQNRHVPDPCVRSTSAHRSLRLFGREVTAENGDICGDYELVGLHMGWPAYQKLGEETALRRQRKHWVVDRQGFRDSDTVVAWALADPDREQPADGMLWHVFQSSQGHHIADTAVGVASLVESVYEPDADSFAAGRRPLSIEESLAKRQRVDSEDLGSHFSNQQNGITAHAGHLGA
eukprot:TRINITY_DN108427_c0_g1_i1.p1 TRINITY_DN108427_c0_g1~~TRINITY_DN108427_c0_g1_i1.p1  ORF type:complete len:508 (+),score=81.37 TRINITY_DN108427_c0_g1_i1:76-1599(+)